MNLCMIPLHVSTGYHIRNATEHIIKSAEHMWDSRIFHFWRCQAELSVKRKSGKRQPDFFGTYVTCNPIYLKQNLIFMSYYRLPGTLAPHIRHYMSRIILIVKLRHVLCACRTKHNTTKIFHMLTACQMLAAYALVYFIFVSLFENFEQNNCHKNWLIFTLG